VRPWPPPRGLTGQAGRGKLVGLCHSLSGEEVSPRLVLPVPPPSRALVIDLWGRSDRVHQVRIPQSLLFWGPFANHKLPGSQTSLVTSPGGGGSCTGAAFWAGDRRLCGQLPHSATFTTPEGPSGNLGLLDEGAPNSRGRQGEIQDRSWPGSTLGPKYPHVASDPARSWARCLLAMYPVPLDRVAAGMASGPRTARVRHTSSVFGQTRHVLR